MRSLFNRVAVLAHPAFPANDESYSKMAEIIAFIPPSSRVMTTDWESNIPVRGVLDAQGREYSVLVTDYSVIDADPLIEASEVLLKGVDELLLFLVVAPKPWRAGQYLMTAGLEHGVRMMGFDEHGEPVTWVDDDVIDEFRKHPELVSAFVQQQIAADITGAQLVPLNRAQRRRAEKAERRGS
jgi:hypothetical protein